MNEFEVGTYIDLRHINRNVEVATSVAKKSTAQEAATRLYEVGTQFVFNLSNKEAKAARRIQVVFA